MNDLRNRTNKLKIKNKMLPSEKKKKRTKPSNSMLQISKYCAITLILIYLFFPFALKYSSTLRNLFLFMNYVNIQAFLNLSLPETDYGLNCTRVFKINSSDSIQLGLWHILPVSKLSECSIRTKDQAYDHYKDFEDNRPVILYLHGNGGTRGGRHRVALYKKLAYEADMHVLAMDYRGYGDSSNIQPTPFGVIQDSLSVYNWLIQLVNISRINVWGHSLGSAISISMINNLSTFEMPNSLILESPFNRIYDVVVNYKLSKVYFCFNFLLDMIGKAFEEDKNNYFNNEKLIKNLNIPILILHARDDEIVPYHLAVKLYKSAMINASKKNKEPKIILYDAYLGYGHKNIWQDSNLTQIIIEFTQTNKI